MVTSNRANARVAFLVSLRRRKIQRHGLSKKKRRNHQNLSNDPEDTNNNLRYMSPKIARLQN